MLASALRHYRRQQQITALAVRGAGQIATRGSAAVAQSVRAYQLAAVMLTLEFTSTELAEQGLAAPAVANVQTASLLTSGAAVADMLDRASDRQAFERLVATLVQDAGRTAAAVDIASRPAITGHVRSLNLPSCARCAVLAGRVYPYSTGFQRHPLCDCLMTPTTQALGKDLILDGRAAALGGQVRGLSGADLEAIESGADLSRVVNVRRRSAGLTVGSSVFERGGRLTPHGALALAHDRAEAVRLLRQAGYLA